MTPDVYLPRKCMSWVGVNFLVGGKCKIPESGAVGGITTTKWCTRKGEDDNALVLFYLKQVKSGQHISWLIIIISLNVMLWWSQRYLQKINHMYHWNALKSKSDKTAIKTSHSMHTTDCVLASPFYMSFFVCRKVKLFATQHVSRNETALDYSLFSRGFLHIAKDPRECPWRGNGYQWAAD